MAPSSLPAPAGLLLPLVLAGLSHRSDRAARLVPADLRAWNTADLRITRDTAAAGAIPSLATLGNTDRHWAHAVFDFVAARRGAEGVRQLLFALRAHETLVQAVPTALGLTGDQFDQEFRNYVITRFGRA